MYKLTFRLAFCILCFTPLVFSCAVNAASAEEYYTIGMAYFDMGKYDEAQKWLERASGVSSTMRASEYNLGRIAYETKKYSIALKHFKSILKRDPKNVMALKSAAYTEIMLGNIEEAAKYYATVLEMEPEDTDDGYNYAMILYAMKKYEEAETVLNKFSYDMPDNKDTLLLLARTKRAEGKVEAIDDYALWLVKNTDPLVRYEYACALEDGEFYARAIEEVKKAITEITDQSIGIKKYEAQFELAKLIFIADNKNEEGAQAFEEAMTGGYKDVEKLRELSKDKRLRDIDRDKVNTAIASLLQKEKTEEEKKAEEEAAKKAAEAAEEGTASDNPTESTLEKEEGVS